MLPLTLVLLDLDDFETLNNTLGRHIGDLVLKIIGWTIQNVLRDKNAIARIDGDRFAMLLPETGADATRMALWQLVPALNGALKTYGWDITFSMVAVTFERPLQ
jgi:diguanylate cyclase (GGDEF)-like protein